MRMRQLRVLAGLLLLAAAAGCSRPISTAPPAGNLPALTWNGSALEGTTFYQRDFAFGTVHYAPYTSPTDVETLGANIDKFLKQLTKEERWDRRGQLSVWVLPPGHSWPSGLSTGLYGGLAVGPGQVLLRGPEVSGLPLNGALALALLQQADSPAFTADWVDNAMGWALASEQDRFLPMMYQMPVVRAPDEMLPALRTPESNLHMQSLAVVATLLLDRYGQQWYRYWDRPWSEFTPSAALQWVTGTTADAEAVKSIGQRAQLFQNPAMRKPLEWTALMSDVGASRLEPKLDSLPPGPGPMASRSASSYDITGRYDPAAGLLTGEVKLTWQNGEHIALDRLYFHQWPNAQRFAHHGGRMTVSEVLVDGQPVPFESQVLDLMVPLRRPVPHGGKAAVTIGFQTRVPVGSPLRPLGMVPDGSFQLVHSFPVLALLDDLGWHLSPFPSTGGLPSAEPADYRLRLEVPPGTTAVAGGDFATLEEYPDRWVYTFEARHVTELAVAGTARPARQKTVRAGTMSVRVTGQDQAWVDAVAAGLEQAVPFFEGRLGPLPFRELDVVEGKGLEYPGMLFLPEADPQNYWREPLYFGLARQWFGGSVATDTWTEPWLHEAFSLYMVPIAMEHLVPEMPRLNVSHRSMAGTLPLASPVDDLLRTGYYEALVAGRGAVKLFGMEEALGEETMERFVRTWVTRYQGQSPTTADFLALVAELAGPELAEDLKRSGIDPAARHAYRPLYPPGKMTP